MIDKEADGIYSCSAFRVFGVRSLTKSLPSFRVHCELDAFEKSGDAHPMRIGGVVSTAKLDRQEERVLQEGLDFSPFLTSGWFNDNHGQRTTDLVGYPTEARYVTKGEVLPTGKHAEENGWWAEGYLLNTDEGRKLWGLTQALKGTPRKLGFSIEGKVESRAAHDSSTITRAIVKNVAVTHCPVNPDTELVPLVKALTAGHAIGNPGIAPGEGFALRSESVDSTLADQDDMRWLDPDADEIEKAETIGAFTVEPMTEHEYMMDWASTLHDAFKAPTKSSDRTLTKAEARIIVRSEYPHLTSEEIEGVIIKAFSLT